MHSSKVNRTYSQYLISSEAYTSAHNLLEQINNTSDSGLLQQTIEDIQLVMAQDYPPNTKILALKLVKNIFLLSKENVISLIQNKILPEVVSVALYKDNQNGATFFSHTNFYQNSDERQKEGFKNQGVDYVSYCKDSIMTWANLVPFTNDGHPSRFSEKYSDLLNRGIMFSKESSLYSQREKETFSKNYKVQFFNEDSSMSDSFLTSSNCVNLIEREIDQCNQLQQALKNTLKPSEFDTDRSRFKTIMQRMNIFFHESSVKMLQQIKSLNMIPQYTNRVLAYQSRFGQIVQDYEYLKSNKMRYERFYDLYGYKITTPQKQSRIDFSPPPSVSNSMIPESNMKKKLTSTSPIQNVFGNPRQSFQPIPLGGKRSKKLQSSNIDPSPNIKSSAAPSIFKQQRRLQQIQLEANEANSKKLMELQQYYKTRLQQQKQQAQFRINQLKKQIGNSRPLVQQDSFKRNNQQAQPFKIRIQQLTEDLKQYEIERQKLRSKNKQLQKDLYQLQKQYHQKDRALKNILQDTQRYKDIANNFEQKIEYLQKQKEYQKQELAKLSNSNRVSSVSEVSNKKLQKKIYNLLQEKQLLKSQLNNQRNRKYEDISNQTRPLKDQIERLKTKLKEKQTKQKEIIIKLDRTEVENIKYKEEVKAKSIHIESLKKQNQWINKTLNQIRLNTPIKTQQKLFSGSLPLTTNRLDIKDYLQLGMEGAVYYEVLSKEFKIKYKRSCFKKKQLLYKLNNIQVGVITNVNSQNNISVTLFITNYGTINITNIKLKILNPTSNLIELDTNQILALNQGEQQKVYIESTIYQYPIGPVVLKLQYPNSHLYETAQLLIPISIIKLVRVINRINPYMPEYKRFQIKYDHKMIQNVSVLKDYFPNVEFRVEDITILRMTVIHDHTSTQWNMDLQIDNDYLTIKWAQIVTGYEEIQEYYCKTLKNLLAK